MAAAMGCGAATRVADAVVTEHEQQLCFGTGSALPMRRLQAVIVSDVTRTPAVTLWETTVDGAAFAHPARACITYGEKSPGTGNADRSAPRLQPGRIYHVFLNVRRENAADPTSGYEAEFCLKPGAAPQQVVVHQVQWDKNLRRKLYEGCNAGK
jgi:hypothetical protein